MTRVSWTLGSTGRCGDIINAEFFEQPVSDEDRFYGSIKGIG